MEKSFYISFISVSESYKGKGVAQLLLNSALTSAKKSGINQISLHVSSSNIRAIRFYSKNQFIRVADSSRYYEMVRELH
jgi:ribosomal protein S18 acetylase RimI-like enzyme